MPTPLDAIADALGEIAHRGLRANADGNRDAVAAEFRRLLAAAREVREVGRELGSATVLPFPRVPRVPPMPGAGDVA